MSTIKFTGNYISKGWRRLRKNEMRRFGDKQARVEWKDVAFAGMKVGWEKDAFVCREIKRKHPK